MTNSKLRERTQPRMLFDRRAPMRDGVELSCDVYLPPIGDGPWPTILNRTPYDNTGPSGTARAVWLAKQDYAVVIQDCRGRGDSGGVFKPFFDDFNDGYDSVEWCATQPWSSGEVGMMGISYGGSVQGAAARDAPPHLKALVSTSAAGRWMEELPYRFGCFSTFWIYWLNAVAGNSGQRHQDVLDVERLLYYRPLKDQDQEMGRERTDWREWLEHQWLDDYWQALSLDGHFQKIDVPALHITGWFDGCDFNGDQMGQLYYWHNMLESSPAGDRQWLYAGPWDHGGTWTPRQKFGERDFGPSAVPDMAELHKRFFDRWLKGEQNGQDAERRVRIFTMGRNEWRDEDQWPPAGTVVTPYYLHSGGRANTLGGDGGLSIESPSDDEPSDSYVYNPDDPTLSTPDLGKFPSPDYPLDNRWRIRRDDVLVYTSAPLAEDLEITGHPFVRLYAASDCPDTDWHVTLCDVSPDGKSEELDWGCMRAACRAGVRQPPTPLEPGTVYEFNIEMPATSNVWKAGHRLRVCVASCHFPQATINPNTGAPIGDDEEVRIATNTVYHSKTHASCLLAPVAPIHKAGT